MLASGGSRGTTKNVCRTSYGNEKTSFDTSFFYAITENEQRQSASERRRRTPIISLNRLRLTMHVESFWYPKAHFSVISIICTIVLSVICYGQATVFTVINSIGIILSEFSSRSVSVILSLHPGPGDTRPDLSNILRRQLRLFLNNVVQYDKSCNSNVKFSSRNLKIYGQNGKSINYFATLPNVRNMFLTLSKCQSNVHA